MWTNMKWKYIEDDESTCETLSDQKIISDVWADDDLKVVESYHEKETADVSM